MNLTARHHAEHHHRRHGGVCRRAGRSLRGPGPDQDRLRHPGHHLGGHLQRRHHDWRLSPDRHRPHEWRRHRPFRQWRAAEHLGRDRERRRDVVSRQHGNQPRQPSLRPGQRDPGRRPSPAHGQGRRAFLGDDQQPDPGRQHQLGGAFHRERRRQFVRRVAHQQHRPRRVPAGGRVRPLRGSRRGHRSHDRQPHRLQRGAFPDQRHSHLRGDRQRDGRPQFCHPPDPRRHGDCHGVFRDARRLRCRHRGAGRSGHVWHGSGHGHGHHQRPAQRRRDGGGRRHRQRPAAGGRLHRGRWRRAA